MENYINPTAVPDEKAIMRYKEKKELSRRTRICVLPSIILLIFMMFFYTLVVLVLALFGVDTEKVYGFLSDAGVSYALSAFLSIFCFTVPFIISAKAGGFKIGELIPLNRPKKGKVLPYLLIGVSVCSFANIVTSYADSVFSMFGIEYNLPENDSPAGVIGFILAVACVSFEPALVEEFAFRGIFQGIFRRYGDGLSVLVSAVFFGLMHGNFVQIPFAFIVGLGLGLIRVKTESIWICAVVHGINNFISVAIEYILISDTAKNLIYTVYLAIAMLLGILGVFLLRNDKKAFKFQKRGLAYNEFVLKEGNIYPEKSKFYAENPLTVKECYKYIFLHPASIVFIVLCLLESCAFFVL